MFCVDRTISTTTLCTQDVPPLIWHVSKFPTCVGILNPPRPLVRKRPYIKVSFYFWWREMKRVVFFFFIKKHETPILYCVDPYETVGFTVQNTFFRSKLTPGFVVHCFLYLTFKQCNSLVLTRGLHIYFVVWNFIEYSVSSLVFSLKFHQC